MVSRLRDHPDLLDVPSPPTSAALVADGPTVIVSSIHPASVEIIEGDVWRTSAPASLLLWIRKLIDSDTVDAVPLTLDPAMADDMALTVSADKTSWDCDTVLLLDYRTHVHTGGLAAKVGTLDAAADVDAVLVGEISAGHTSAPSIHDSADQRLEYRDLLRIELSNYAPSIWAETHPPIPQHWNVSREELALRLDGITFAEWSGLPRVLAPGVNLVPCVKSAYLGSVVLICRLTDPDYLANTDLIVRACRSFVSEEHEADAVAVFAAEASQQSIVLRRADMRQAISLPTGELTEPGPYLADLPLVDILFKHFDRYAFASSLTADDEMPEVKQRDLTTLASEQVRAAATRVASSGRAARQIAKQNGYAAAVSNLPSIEAFLLDAARGDIEAALQNLIEREVGDEKP
jgi:hypothetical protein